MIKRDLKKFLKETKGYTEIRTQENSNFSIALLNGDLVANSRNSTSGVCARVEKNSSFGFSSNPDLTDDAITNVVKAATDNAVFLDSKQNNKESKLPSNSTESENDLSTKKTKLSQKELIEFTKEIDNYITKLDNIKSRTVNLSSLTMAKNLVTSDGSYSYSVIPKTNMVIKLVTEKDGRPFDLYDFAGGLGEFEDNFSNPSDLFPVVDKIYDNLMKKRNGVYAQAGIKDCILDADLAGILAHEAIGHTVEADLVMGGSIAGDYINTEVSSPLITLVDYANEALGKTCPVPVYVDDEGTRAQDAVIIENGVLKRFLHNKDSALHFGMEPLGNARAYNFSDEPIIRMRNTAILPGKSKLEEMIATIDDGYYLIKPGNGQADSTGEFMFGIPLGYEIKNGKIGNAIFDTTISGMAFDVLKSVTMVSDDMSWGAWGMCGKSQMIPVGMGGPAIKCKVNLGGK